MKTPLSVHTLFHSENKEGEKIYSELYKLLCRDVDNPFSDGLDIPVYYASGDDTSEIQLANSSSKKRVLLLFIDIHMFCSKVWRNKISEIVSSDDDNTLIVGIKQYKHSFSINKQIGEIQSIVVDHGEKDKVSMFENNHWLVFTTQLFDLLIRFLKGKKEEKTPIKVFISHSKQGNKTVDREGETTAKAVREFLYADTKLNSFFDVHDILDGYKFGDQIKKHAGNSSVLILFTDTYSSREWCRIEALTAKENKVPIVAVFMMKNIIGRVFPYIGNVPSVLFDGDWRKVINLLLRTTLDQTVEKALLEPEANETTSFIPYPPEAFNMSMLEAKTQKILYPEPPLGNEELEVLKKIANNMGRNIKFCTPMSYFTEDLNLQEKQIGVSIAESADMSKFGIGEEMFKNLIIELTRHILKANGRMIYGGDLRKKGYTELFNEIAKQYGQKEKTEADVQYIKNYLSWPLYNDLKQEQRADYLASRIELIEVKPGSAVEAEEGSIYVPNCSEDTMLKWATSLQRMREESIGESFARIIAGGKMQGSSGFMQGIAEEFMIAYKAKKPIFIIGGFGGCAHLISDILEGKISSKILKDTASQNAGYKAFYERYTNDGNVIDFDFFDCINIERLNNGLDKDENIQLFHSVDIIEIVSLVLKGLKTILK